MAKDFFGRCVPPTVREGTKVFSGVVAGVAAGIGLEYLEVAIDNALTAGQEYGTAMLTGTANAVTILGAAYLAYQATGPIYDFVKGKFCPTKDETIPISGAPNLSSSSESD
jgi:hypothetical protein